MSPDYFSPDNVLVVSFGEDPENDTNAYQALTDLKQLDSQGQIEIAGAAVVTRDADGRVDVKSEVGDAPYAGTASGGIIGLLIGIIGGPLGVLIGGTYGTLVGSLFDIDDVETTESVLGEISKQVQPTRTALLAQVTEQSPEVIDTAMARLGGEVMRRPVVDVEEEIAAAQEAQRKARARGPRGTAQGSRREDQGGRTRQGRGAEVEAHQQQGRRDRLDGTAMHRPVPAQAGAGQVQRVAAREIRATAGLLGPDGMRAPTGALLDGHQSILGRESCLGRDRGCASTPTKGAVAHGHDHHNRRRRDLLQGLGLGPTDRLQPRMAAFE